MDKAARLQPDDAITDNAWPNHATPDVTATDVGSFGLPNARAVELSGATEPRSDAGADAGSPLAAARCPQRGRGAHRCGHGVSAGRRHGAARAAGGAAGSRA
jgi:hypothetical protein